MPPVDTFMFLSGDTLKNEATVMRQQISLRVVRGLVIVGEIPYISETYQRKGDDKYSSSGVGDLDLFIKYRPVTSDNPVILVMGARLPTGDSEKLPALGDNYTNLVVGIMNVSGKNGLN
jgi:hypothetical protein